MFYYSLAAPVFCWTCASFNQVSNQQRVFRHLEKKDARALFLTVAVNFFTGVHIYRRLFSCVPYFHSVQGKDAAILQ